MESLNMNKKEQEIKELEELIAQLKQRLNEEWGFYPFIELYVIQCEKNLKRLRRREKIWTKLKEFFGRT